MVKTNASYSLFVPAAHFLFNARSTNLVLEQMLVVENCEFIGFGADFVLEHFFVDRVVRITIEIIVLGRSTIVIVHGRVLLGSGHHLAVRVLLFRNKDRWRSGGGGRHGHHFYIPTVNVLWRCWVTVMDVARSSTGDHLAFLAAIFVHCFWCSFHVASSRIFYDSSGKKSNDSLQK